MCRLLGSRVPRQRRHVDGRAVTQGTLRPPCSWSALSPQRALTAHRVATQSNTDQFFRGHCHSASPGSHTDRVGAVVIVYTTSMPSEFGNDWKIRPRARQMETKIPALALSRCPRTRPAGFPVRPFAEGAHLPLLETSMNAGLRARQLWARLVLGHTRSVPSPIPTNQILSCPQVRRSWTERMAVSSHWVAPRHRETK